VLYEETADVRPIVSRKSATGQRSNRLNYVPALLSYIYSVNADASNEQLILNQLLNVLIKALKMKRLTTAIPKAR